MGSTYAELALFLFKIQMMCIGQTCALMIKLHIVFMPLPQKLVLQTLGGVNEVTTFLLVGHPHVRDEWNLLVLIRLVVDLRGGAAAKSNHFLFKPFHRVTKALTKPRCHRKLP